MATRSVKIARSQEATFQSTFHHPHYVQKAFLALEEKTAGTSKADDISLEAIHLISLVSAGGKILYYRTLREIAKSKVKIRGYLQLVSGTKKREITKALAQFYRNLEFWAHLKEKDIKDVEKQVHVLIKSIEERLFFHHKGNTFLYKTNIRTIKYLALKMIKRIDKTLLRSKQEALIEVEQIINDIKKDLEENHIIFSKAINQPHNNSIRRDRTINQDLEILKHLMEKAVEDSSLK